MAKFEFKLPDIGEGVSEGEIVEWHIKLGQSVAEDQPMVEVMTDKATVTIDVPRAGTVSDLRFEAGATAQVGEVIVVITTDAQAAETKTAEAKPQTRSSQALEEVAPAKEAAATAVGDIREGLPGSNYFAAGNTAPDANSFFQAKPLASPAVRKLARDLHVELQRVRPSGTGGRVTKQDVQRAATSGASATIAAGGRTEGRPAATTPAKAGPKPGERKPFVGIRRRIAEHMQAAKNTAAHFTFVEECDATHLVASKNELQPGAQQRGIKLTYLPFIVRAVARALERHPALNSSLDTERNELVYHKHYDIGIAAATDQGLVVPVLRDALGHRFGDLCQEIDRLGAGARAGTLKANELNGSTFTVTSLGKLGGLMATPILNFPEVGILGVHRIKERPVVRDGAITIGQVMLLSLSFDHRLVDGHVGAAFAYDIIDQLENPSTLILEEIW